MWIPKPPNVPYGLKCIVDNYLPSEEIQPFAEWAFGEDFLQLGDIINYAKKWNELHKDIYDVDMAEAIVHSLKIMCELWKEHGKGPV
jgi:hypothetical protein